MAESPRQSPPEVQRHSRPWQQLRHQPIRSGAAHQVRPCAQLVQRLGLQLVEESTSGSLSLVVVEQATLLHIIDQGLVSSLTSTMKGVGFTKG